MICSCGRLMSARQEKLELYEHCTGCGRSYRYPKERRLFAKSIRKSDNDDAGLTPSVKIKPD